MKRHLIQHGLIIIISSIIACAISLGYFAYLPAGQTFGSLAYLSVATFSQMGLLVCLWGLITLPLVLIKPNKIRALATAIAFAFLLIIFYADTQVFAQYRYHIQWVFIEMLLSGGMLEITTKNILVLVIAISLCVAVLYSICRLFQKDNLLTDKPINKTFYTLLFCCLLATHLTHIWASAQSVRVITTQNQLLPLFYPATANGLMRKLGWLDEQSLAQQKGMQLKEESTLNYPLAPIQLTKPTKPVNIIFIVIDSWRWDSMTAEYSPNIWQFSQGARRFEKHLSTGNATRTGIFGLFYGVPATYWHSFYANRRSPVLMDAIQKNGYQLGIFASAHLLNPQFNQTVFVNVPDLRVKSESPTAVSRDQEITDLWINWNAHRDQNQAAFSFLFYDAPHVYAFPNDYPVKFEPMSKGMDYMELGNDYDSKLLRNRYMTSVHYVDSLIGKVIKAAEHSPDWQNTLIVITGDHGQEINDNHLNYWGHNSNFTAAQTQVPMIIAGPGIRAGTETMTTSHEDIAPTLLSHYLGVTNPISDYSTGQDMLAPKQKSFHLLASYNDYALVSDTSILTVNKESGSYQWSDTHLQPKSTKPDFHQLQQALKTMRKFLN